MLRLQLNCPDVNISQATESNVMRTTHVASLLTGFFQSIFCFTFLCNFFDLYAFTTFTNKTITPSHRSHTITPLSNQHTIIIPKSIELRNIYNINIRFDQFFSTCSGTYSFDGQIPWHPSRLRTSFPPPRSLSLLLVLTRSLNILPRS